MDGIKQKRGCAYILCATSNFIEFRFVDIRIVPNRKDNYYEEGGFEEIKGCYSTKFDRLFDKIVEVFPEI